MELKIESMFVLLMALHTRISLTYAIELPVGNPGTCKTLYNHNRSNINVLEVLPGGGWDNLQNLAMGRVLALDYSSCRTTEDGKYLLPDYAFVIPQKTSQMDLFSEMFESWHTYSSATASSINLEASFPSVVSGSFSTDYQYNKNHQINDQSITTRVQVRHMMYTVKTQPDAPLDPAFRHRLLQIAANLQNNNTDIAWYEAQLLIRDFGTHYTTTVDAGAALIQEDHIRAKFVKDSQLTSTQVKAAASRTLFEKVNLSIAIQNSQSKSRTDEYTGNQTSSRIYTFGGPPFQAGFSIADWQSGLKDELVAIDRNGDPLHFIVNSATLPSLPEPTVRQLASMVEKAIALYYKVNTFPGCLDPESLNFNYMANIGDGSCNAPAFNFTIGGVYQYCYPRKTAAGNLCKQLQQKNPLTGDFSCPKGYQSVKLLSSKGGKRPSVTKAFHRTECRVACRPCGFLFLSECCKKVCTNKLYYSSAEYETYWCAANYNTTNPPGTGLLFGGVYTDVSDNPLTGAQRCPSRFHPLPLGGHAHICISDDYEMAYQNSIQFAGFFSCSAGNPLAAKRQTPATRRSARQTVVKYVSKVEAYMAQKTTGQEYSGPKECPHGYSNHLVIVDNDCVIDYCIKTGALREKVVSTFKRPPFNPRPSGNPDSTEAMAVVGANGKVWYKNHTTKVWNLESDEQDSFFQAQSGDIQGISLSKNGAAAVSACVTGAIGIVIALVVLGLYKRKRRQTSYREDDASVCYSGPASEDEALTITTGTTSLPPSSLEHNS